MIEETCLAAGIYASATECDVAAHCTSEAHTPLTVAHHLLKAGQPEAAVQPAQPHRPHHVAHAALHAHRHRHLRADGVQRVRHDARDAARHAARQEAVELRGRGGAAQPLRETWKSDFVFTDASRCMGGAGMG